ncbi:MAG: aminotransferase class III-fold pyridoxal phosphate-dependent enzyme [Geodermatophilaceae bacterium]|jgi:4-aminobutyrate aminotransferase/(S)-3-amino-2-methylpropionate transaminase|nr:aminotransferase class III-fold pyridoxal phosphate-dependent enzyme [Geodermatophilaceae bacterium]
MLPVFITDASGGVLRDVDGNSLIDLGAGIAVVSVGNAAPHVVQRVRE